MRKEFFHDGLSFSGNMFARLQFIKSVINTRTTSSQAPYRLRRRFFAPPVRSLRCSSFPNRTRCAGLRFGSVVVRQVRYKHSDQQKALAKASAFCNDVFRCAERDASCGCEERNTSLCCFFICFTSPQAPYRLRRRFFCAACARSAAPPFRIEARRSGFDPVFHI